MSNYISAVIIPHERKSISRISNNSAYPFFRDTLYTSIILVNSINIASFPGVLGDYPSRFCDDAAVIVSSAFRGKKVQRVGRGAEEEAGDYRLFDN